MADLVLTPKKRSGGLVLTPKGSSPQDQSLSWLDVPINALMNAPASAMQFASDMVQPILHPIQTGQSIMDLGAGTLREGARAILPEAAFNFIDQNEINPEAAARASETAKAVGRFYNDRYGSTEGIKNALSTDPVGILSDVATVLSGGAGIATKTGKMATLAGMLEKGSKYTNPLTAVEVAAAGTGKVVKPISKAILGAMTGAGGDAIGEAYEAGRKGGTSAEALRRNMRGHENQDAVVGEARAALGNIDEARRRQYQSDMASVNADKTPIDMAPIEKRFQDLVDSAYKNGHQVADDATISKLKKIGEAIDEWSKDPSMQTAGGLDALKQKIGNLAPNFTEKTANMERMVTGSYNAVKDAIVKQAPQYAGAMENYETSKTVQREIERALSLGKKSSTDTALRKLQSVMRNNANTNYGSRMKNAEVLADAGADTMLPRLAGQSLNAALPRGILKALMGGGLLGVGTGLLSPTALAALPLASPRLVGEAAVASGALARKLKAIPKPTKEQLLMLRLIGSLSENSQPAQ